MNRSRPVNRASVAARLRTAAINAPGPMPTADIADIAATAWRLAVVHPTDLEPDRHRTLAALDAAFERRRRGAEAVVEAVYPHGATAGLAAGTDAVAGHIVAACAEAMTGLSNHTSHDRVVRRLLSRLTTAAHEETQRGHDPTTDDPPPRTYLTAYGDGRERYDAQRVATAARVAWTHGFDDGWHASYWSANLILGTLGHDDAITTTAIAGEPTLEWLDRLVHTARRIADHGPVLHAARLAQLAGCPDPASRTSDAPPASRTGVNSSNRRPRKM